MSHINENTLILIDGYGFVFRAYHSMPPLTRADGIAVGAVYGFTSMLLKLLGSYPAHHVAVVIDGGGKNFRHTMYEKYKANRPPAPEDLIPQFPMIREAAEALSLPVIGIEGFEADDIIATYARLAKEEGREVMIVSSDKDLMQLVDDKLCMFDPMKSLFIRAEQVQEKFGVPPNLVGDLLALTGDSSDNIPGVPGIGPKTAAELLLQFGNLDEVLARASSITQNKRRETLLANIDNAKLSRRLVELECNVPVPLTVEQLSKRTPEPATLLNFIAKNNFKSLLARAQKFLGGEHELPIVATPSTEVTPSAITPLKHITIEHITTPQQLDEWIKRAGDLPQLAIIPEYKDGTLEGFGIAANDHTLAFLDVKENNSAPTDLFSPAPEPSPHTRALINRVNELFHSPSLRLLTHDGKEFLHAWSLLNFSSAALTFSSPAKGRWRDSDGGEASTSATPPPSGHLPLAGEELSMCRIDDTMILSYLLHGGLHEHSLTELTTRYLQDTIPTAEHAAQQAAHNAATIFKLFHTLYASLIEQKCVSLYERLDRPLAYVLNDMENSGIRVDAQKLKTLSTEWQQEIAHIETQIFALATHPFNIGSPKQLGEVLFDEMKLPGGKKSGKSGHYSTGADILEELDAQGHEIAKHILMWRQLSKLKSTYADALQKQIKSDGRIHTHYAMTATSTGRLSSIDPNLQNIPIRTKEGYKIRGAFIAEKGATLISADYSQIELRLLAHMADIPTLKEAFRQGQDIHARTASDIFGIPLESVDDEIRRRAKAINFGIVYGMSAFGLASRLGISRNEASEFIDRYFKRYPGISDYIHATTNFAKEHAYVLTLWGRKCFVPGIKSPNGAIRQFSERAAINAPLQGTAADIIKRAMVTLHEALRKKFSRNIMLLQVHDELVFEVPEEEIESTTHLIRTHMESAAQLTVPLTVDISHGKSWAEMG